MKANELRIGNIVLFKAKQDVVSEISNAGHILCEIGGFGNLDKGYIEPIPLTEEWLVKFGFKQDMDGWKLKDESYIYDEGFLHTDIGDAYRVSIVPIKYVHQLQNLYFALTGEELIVK